MIFLREIEGITRGDRIRNTSVLEKLKVRLVEEVIQERQH